MLVFDRYPTSQEIYLRKTNVREFIKLHNLFYDLFWQDRRVDEPTLRKVYKSFLKDTMWIGSLGFKDLVLNSEDAKLLPCNFVTRLMSAHDLNRTILGCVLASIDKKNTEPVVSLIICDEAVGRKYTRDYKINSLK